MFARIDNFYPFLAYWPSAIGCKLLAWVGVGVTDNNFSSLFSSETNALNFLKFGMELSRVEDYHVSSLHVDGIVFMAAILDFYLLTPKFHHVLLRPNFSFITLITAPYLGCEHNFKKSWAAIFFVKHVLSSRILHM